MSFIILLSFASYVSVQLLVRARDQRVPEKSATATVTVRILRNNLHPFFERIPYSVAIPETTTVGSFVYSVQARDLDLRVGYLGFYVNDCFWNYFLSSILLLGPILNNTIIVWHSFVNHAISLLFLMLKRTSHLMMT